MWLRRFVVLIAVVVVLAIALFVYVRAGWSHTEAYCSNGQGGEQVGFSWSWNPPGFTCTYIGGKRDGDVETSLWF